MESPSNRKEQLREALKKTRQALHQERRDDASRALVSSLVHHLCSYQNVLSFASFQGEIDTTLLNLYLSTTGRLVLPKMKGETLKLYRVLDCEGQLTPNTFGLREPIADLCEEIAHQEIGVILVPALGFDRHKNRLGYGKGYYDRLLAEMTKREPTCPTIGIGFKEQLTETLPTDAHDIPMGEVALF